MFLRTKRFFQKTIESFKIFVSKTKGSRVYERLPKTPPFQRGRNDSDKDTETGYKELENFYSEFTKQWDSHKNKTAKKQTMRTSKKQLQELKQESVMPIFTKQMKETERSVLKQSDLCSMSVRETRLSSVVHKLQELEHIDKGNVDYKLDIEEILHYYSRLTCPAYLDIVDKFLLEMCAEFFSSELNP